MNNIVIVHVELLGFLMNNNTKLSLADLLNYLSSISKFRPSDLNEANYVLIFATNFIDRIPSERVNEKNGSFFFEYMDILKNPQPYLDSQNKLAAESIEIDEKIEETKNEKDDIDMKDEDKDESITEQDDMEIEDNGNIE